MAITPKEKELAAVGISVATGCKPCTDHHMKAVRKAGASEKEIKQAVADALEVRKDATEIRGAKEALDGLQRMRSSRAAMRDVRGYTFREHTCRLTNLFRGHIFHGHNAT